MNLEFEYTEIGQLYDEFLDKELNLKKKAINGIKKLLKENSINSYNLIENDIFVALYDDGSDYHTILCESISINKYDMLIVTSDDNTEHDEEDLSASVLYFIFTLLYEKIYNV